MTKTNIENNISEAYERMVKNSQKILKSAPKTPTNKDVEKTLKDLLKGIK